MMYAKYHGKMAGKNHLQMIDHKFIDVVRLKIMGFMLHIQKLAMAKLRLIVWLRECHIVINGKIKL